jgi:hypothetical protein
MLIYFDSYAAKLIYISWTFYDYFSYNIACVGNDISRYIFTVH